MLDYDRLIQESTEALGARERRLRHSRVSYRVRMLRLLKSGECWSMASVAEKLGYSLRQSQRWFACCREDGLKALLKFEQPRRSEQMTQAAYFQELRKTLSNRLFNTLETLQFTLTEALRPFW